MSHTPYTDGYSRIDWRDPRELAEVLGDARGITATTTPPRHDEFILPDLGWAVLLDRIVIDAKPGSVIVTYSEIMRVVCQQTIDDAGRTDLTVELRIEPMK